MAIDLTSNCIGHWKMNDYAANKTIADSSGNGNNGTAKWNTEDISALGKINRALGLMSIDSDFFNFGTGPTITGTGVFAISLWVKFINRDKNQMMVNQRSTGSAHGSYTLNILNSNYPHFTVYNGGNSFNLTSDTTINNDSWHHVMAQRISTTEGELYLDNVLVASGSGPVKSLNNVPVVMGRWNGGGQYMDGRLDDVRIWDGRTLNTEERAFLWYNGSGTEKSKTCTRPLVGGSLAGKRGLT